MHVGFAKNNRDNSIIASKVMMAAGDAHQLKTMVHGSDSAWSRFRQPGRGLPPPAPLFNSVSPHCILTYTKRDVKKAQSSRDARDSEAGGRHPKTEVAAVAGDAPAPAGGAHIPRYNVPTPAPQDTTI